MLAGPIVPDAPGLFSITIFCPRCFSVASASARMPMSVPPPAGHGTIKVTGRVGKLLRLRDSRERHNRGRKQHDSLHRSLSFAFRRPEFSGYR